MLKKKQKNSSSNHQLLTEKERQMCQKIAEQDVGLNSQRASALLILEKNINATNAAITPDRIDPENANSANTNSIPSSTKTKHATTMREADE